MSGASTSGHCAVSCVENALIDNVDRLSSAEGRDLVEDIRELDFVFFVGYVSYVRRADNLVHPQQWMIDVLNRLLLEHIDRSHAGMPLFESADQDAGFNQARPAGVD